MRKGGEAVAMEVKALQARQVADGAGNANQPVITQQQDLQVQGIVITHVQGCSTVDHTVRTCTQDSDLYSNFNENLSKI